MERRLHIPPYDYAAALTLERELRVSHVVAQILVRRGHDTPDVARAWLAAAEAHDPSAFAGIADATALVLRHVAAKSRITVHGDYDVDGVCSTAIVVRAVRALGADVDWFLPSRIDDGYGLAAATVDKLAVRGTRLLITVDCAVTAVDEVAAAKAAGLDVLVTDHHAPRADGVLPDAPIVHPTVSGYPCPDLCAAGVAYKLVGALARAAGTDPALADEDLDLVALATICDVVPLRGENRRLVRAGLRALSTTAKPGLRALMRVARVDPGGLDASAVGFRLGPRINAAGRLRRADAGVELLLTADEERAGAIASELDEANVERRAVERRILWDAEAQVAEQGERFSYVLAAEGWHPGVIGIVASRIAERHYRPTVLVALDGDEGMGSGRSIPGFDLLAGLHASAAVLTRYGGHRAAAGLTMRTEDVPALREAFEAHAAAALTPEQLVPVDRIDAIVAGGALGLELAEELTALGPCGAGNPEPALLVPAATLSDPRPMGEEGRHLRFTLQSGGVRSRGVAFGCDGRLPVAPDEAVDVAVRLERNEWNGAVEPRVKLRHAAPCDSGPITVVGVPESHVAALLAAASGAAASITHLPPPTAREVLDRRADGAAATLADLVASGASVLAVVANVPRRLPGLADRLGGFALTSWAVLEADPEPALAAEHLVALDPPACLAQEHLLRAGRAGLAHLCHGDDERRFALNMLEHDYDLRQLLVDLYRALRERRSVAGPELEAFLEGDGPRPRDSALAARLVTVLLELNLAELDATGPVTLRYVHAERTALERSPTYREAQARLEEGRTVLGTALPRAA
jgi:single-stranded-DNA-specific exonuclease